MQKGVFIVIAAFNEEQKIAEVIKEIKKNGFKNIILVDDGSVDDTYEKALKNKVLALKHNLNRGKGAAIKTGFEAAKKLGAEVVVTLDGDGQHDPSQIAFLVDQLNKKSVDVVLGTRMINTSSGMPFLKILGNHLANFFTFLIFGLWVSDSQSGYRAYSKKALNLINIKRDRYDFDSAIIGEISFHKLKFVEIPIKVRYTTYSMNKKYKQSLANGLRTLFKMALS